MTILVVLLAIGLTGVSPTELEIAGSLAEAGLAWQEEGDLGGQARILCRLLEEALYAGHGNRARILIDDLARFGIDIELVDFWYARLAWITGLESMAIEELESFTGDGWLAHRARGLAHILRRHPEDAIPELESSLRSAGTTRKRYYSALDLCWAELASGNIPKAMQIATFLTEHFPQEGLPDIMLALCFQRSGSFASAMMLLQNTSADQSMGTGPRSMAKDLLEDFE